MLIENTIYKQDIDAITMDSNITWNQLNNKTVFVTGATGLIGALVISTLQEVNKKLKLNCRIIAGVRNMEKAIKYFGAENNTLRYYVADITKPIDIKGSIDFIVHTASQTSSKEFVFKPVETSNVILEGTRNVLNLAKQKGTEKLVYLSTMEIYGTPSNDDRIYESNVVSLCAGSVRNCYPLSKAMASNLCASYASEYNVTSAVLVLTQTFGAGVQYNDSRVFAEFARSVIEGRDIVLHTKGETKRSYVYTADAVRAILLVLLNGKQGFDIFNVTNEETYCSILEMANTFCEHSLGRQIVVRIELDNPSNYGYAPTLCMNLDSGKLRELGWKPNYNFDLMVNNLIRYMVNERETVMESSTTKS